MLEEGEVEQAADRQCQAFSDLIAGENDFCVLEESSNGIHPLARWYGIREFVVVVPIKNVLNESQIRILLSSIHISVAESGCEVPVFVQVLKKHQNVFLGVCESRNFRVSFDIVHLQVKFYIFFDVFFLFCHF